MWITKLSVMFCMSCSYTCTTTRRYRQCSHKDFASWGHFCRWFLHSCVEEPNFPWQILFTDEAKFTREVVLNSFNSHVWANENPHTACSHGFQEWYSLNIWAWFLDGCVTGPYLVPPISWVPHTCDSLKAYCMGSWIGLPHIQFSWTCPLFQG